MLMLGIDTSSNYLNVVLGKDGDLISEVSLNIPRKHIANMPGVLDSVFIKSGLTINDVDLFVVVRGPGSFSGIRIAVAAVKGLTYALNKKCVSLNSLDLLASNIDFESKALIIPLIDAKRGQVYTAYYKKNKDLVLRTSDYMLVKIEELLNKLETPVVLLGDGVENYKDIIGSAVSGKKISILDKSYGVIKCSNIVKLGYKKYLEAGFEDIFDLKPFYIYPEDCTIRKN